MISDSRICLIISKGPKYRFPAHIDFTKCREVLNDYCTRWCKREHVESNALNNWKLNIFQIIDKRISFYLNNLDLLPRKPKFSFRHLKQGSKNFIGSMSWFLQIKPATMLLLSDGFITLIP